ncbi:MAG TPA: hypothetical protein VFU97_06440 [Xanthobacteraceae bacterium]|nr:hypothetical protein [Xanthobacteraceae bacterium]
MAAEAAAAEATMTTPEAAAAKAGMTAAEATAPEATAAMTTATAAAATSATSRRCQVSHGHHGQRGRAKSQDEQFDQHRTLLARIAPHLPRFDPRLTPRHRGASGSRNRSQPRGTVDSKAHPSSIE